MKAKEEIEPTGASAEIERREPGFTPGPWAAFKGLLEDEGIWVMSTHVEDAVVASIGMDLPEAEVNARLIAAAPSLYEALRDTAVAVHKIGAYHNPRSVPFEQCKRTTCVKVRAALALVDGTKDEEENHEA